MILGHWYCTLVSFGAFISPSPLYARWRYPCNYICTSTVCILAFLPSPLSYVGTKSIPPQEIFHEYFYCFVEPFKCMHKAQAGALPKCMKRRVPLTISKRKIVDAPSYMLDLLCWMDIFTVQQISSSAQKVKVLHFLLFYQILWQRLFDVHFFIF